MLRRLSRKALPLVVARPGTTSDASALRGYSGPAAAIGDPFFGFTTSTPHKFEVDRAKLVNWVPPEAPGTWFGLRQKQNLWVRQSYFTLWEEVQARLNPLHSNGLVVNGSPGIGKSVGGINTIAALSIQDDPSRMVVVIRSESSHIFANGLWREAPIATRLDGVLDVLVAIACPTPGSQRQQLLLLHDVSSAVGSWSFPYQQALALNLKRRYAVHCVLFVSPQVANYSQFQKDFPTADSFYMPTWSLEELQAVGEALKVSRDHRATLL